MIFLIVSIEIFFIEKKIVFVRCKNMTDISEVLSSIKKVNSIIDEIQTDSLSSLKNMKKGFEDIKVPIQELIEF